jgi:hypothetical protein
MNFAMHTLFAFFRLPHEPVGLVCDRGRSSLMDIMVGMPVDQWIPSPRRRFGPRHRPATSTPLQISLLFAHAGTVVTISRTRGFAQHDV